MGDRCYMQVTCRRQDQERFAELGFVLEFEETSTSPVVEMLDEEANYGHSGHLPTDIPFVGWNGPGGNYGPGKVACDGNELVEACGTQDGFVVAWDKKTNAPTPESLDNIRHFLRVHDQVKAMFKELAKT